MSEPRDELRERIKAAKNEMRLEGNRPNRVYAAEIADRLAAVPSESDAGLDVERLTTALYRLHFMDGEPDERARRAAEVVASEYDLAGGPSESAAGPYEVAQAILEWFDALPVGYLWKPTERALSRIAFELSDARAHSRPANVPR